MIKIAGAIATNAMKNLLLNRAFKTSPDNGAYVSGAIGTSAVNPVAGDTALGTVISGWNSGSDYKGYESGSPTFDTTNRRVSTRMFVSSTQANSNTITEYVDVNGDGTPTIGGRFVFTGIAKTSNIQIFIKPTYRMI